MKGYAFVNKLTGLISSIQSWGDDRDLPVDVPISPDVEVITIEDIKSSHVKPDCFRYDHATSEFVEFTPAPPGPQPLTKMELLEEKVSKNQTAIDFILMNFQKGVEGGGENGYIFF